MHDAVIVGGGPAGASAALLLARAGIETLVIERSEFPRTKACGEYLGAGTVRRLHELGLGESLALHAARLEGIRLFGNGVRAELRFSEPGWALPRAQLDDALLRAAIGAGARCLHARVEDVESKDGFATLRIREPDGATRTIASRMVVGSDGAHSIVAKRCNLTVPARGEQRFALGGHYCGFTALPPFVQMFVEGSCYFAVNPFDAARANVMLIVPENDLAARKHDVDRFLGELAERLSAGSLHFGSARLEGKRIAIGPLAHSTRALRVGRILLAGDAAGFVDPFIGQGVYLALLAGASAASTIRAAFDARARTDFLLAQYDAGLRREMLARERLARIVRSFVRSPMLSKRVARNLQRDPARGQALIDAIAGCAPPGTALRFRNVARLIA